MSSPALVPCALMVNSMVKYNLHIVIKEEILIIILVQEVFGIRFHNLPHCIKQTKMYERVYN